MSFYVLQEMKRRIILIFRVVGTLAFLSLFPTWNFSERTRLSQEKNPLWNSELKPSKTALTKALRNEGLSFQALQQNLWVNFGSGRSPSV